MGRQHKPKRTYRVECPYCGGLCECVTGDAVYPDRADLERKLFYLCRPCNAYVGTHQKTGEPLGIPANRQLRLARIQAHGAFDTLWKHGPLDRGMAYQWLADQLGIKLKACHIGQFNIEQCRQVVAAVAGFQGVSVKYHGRRNGNAQGTGGSPGPAGESLSASEDAAGSLAD